MLYGDAKELKESSMIRQTRTNRAIETNIRIFQKPNLRIKKKKETPTVDFLLKMVLTVTLQSVRS